MDDRSPISSINDSEESSDFEAVVNVNGNTCTNPETPPAENICDKQSNNNKNICKDNKEKSQGMYTSLAFESKRANKYIEKKFIENRALNLSENGPFPHTVPSNVSQNVLLQLIEAGQLEVHTEEDGSGHQYVAIPLPTANAERKQSALSNENDDIKISVSHKESNLKNDTPSSLIIKEDA